MALKDLLVCVDQADSSLARMQLALDLATRHGSRLTALFVRERSRSQLDARKAAELGLVTADGLRNLDEQIEGAIRHAAERLGSALAASAQSSTVEAEFRVIDGSASRVVPQQARYADLCILGPDQSDGPASAEYTFSEHLLFLSGRPVLFVPDNASFTTLGRHVAVAWNSSRPAARSLNDAMPLLERAERITVLMVNPLLLPEWHTDPGGERISRHLARHGTVSEIVRIDNIAHNAIADTLQGEAQSRGADLIVAGAFGHPRLWEKFLGGVTHDLLARIRLPLFMSY
jgi:nucleotide-binding universal stress UspA family protein